MAILRDRPVEAEARLRAKNQVTMPDPIVKALDAEVDDIIVFQADPEEAGLVHLRVLPRTFAGSMRGVYGTTAEVLEFQRKEHAAWAE